MKTTTSKIGWVNWFVFCCTQRKWKENYSIFEIILFCFGFWFGMKKKSPVLTNRFLLFILIISFGHNLKLTLSLFLNCLGFFCFSELFYITNFDFQARFIYRISLYFCNEWFFSLCFSSVWLVCVNGNCFFLHSKSKKMLSNAVELYQNWCVCDRSATQNWHKKKMLWWSE